MFGLRLLDRHHVFALMAAETQGLMAAVASLRSHWAKPSSVRPFATTFAPLRGPIRVVGIDDRVDRRRVDVALLRQELFQSPHTHSTSENRLWLSRCSPWAASFIVRRSSASDASTAYRADRRPLGSVRPVGTDGWSVEQLAEVVIRDFAFLRLG